MKYSKNLYEQSGDIYSPKSFLNNLSPKQQQFGSKKPEEYYQQHQQQNIARNSSTNLKQNQQNFNGKNQQNNQQFDRTVSMDSFQKNKENFQYSMLMKNSNFNKNNQQVDSKNKENLQERESKNNKPSGHLMSQELMKQSQQFLKNSQNMQNNGQQSQPTFKKNPMYSSINNVLGHRDSQQGPYTRDTSNTRDSQYLSQKQQPPQQQREKSKEQQRESMILNRESNQRDSNGNNSKNYHSKDQYQTYCVQRDIQSNSKQNNMLDKDKTRPSSSKNLGNHNNFKDVYSNVQTQKNSNTFKYQNLGHFQQQSTKMAQKPQEENSSRNSIMKKFFENNNDKSNISDKSAITQNTNNQTKKNQEKQEKMMFFFEQQDKKVNTQESDNSINIDKKSHNIYKSQVQPQTSVVEKGKSTYSQVFNLGTGMNSPKMQNFFPENRESNTKDDGKLKRVSRHEAEVKTQNSKMNNEKNEKGERNFKEEYVEYKKLQEKLNFLENKIMHIKSNIDHTYQKEKDDTRPQSSTNKIQSLKNSQSIKQVSMKNSQVQQPIEANSQVRQSSVHKNSNNQIQHNSQERTPQPRPQNKDGQSHLEKQQYQQQLQERQQLQQQMKQQQERQVQIQEEKRQQLQQQQQQLQQLQQQQKMQNQQNQQKQNNNKNQKQTNQASLSSFVTQVPQNGGNTNSLQQTMSINSKKNSIKSANSSNQKNQSTKNSAVFPQSQSTKNSQTFMNKNSCQLNSSPYIYYISSVAYACTNDDNGYFPSLFREHWQQTVQGIGFAKMLKPVPGQVLEEKRIPMAKKDNNKKTLVFDLDETLIHCQESTNMPCDVILPIQFPTGEVIEAGINIRPYCMEILQELSKYYEIVVFTASHSCYANVVLDYLDPNHKYIQYRLFRENCIQTEEGVYIKDLRVLTNRNMQNIILVDNAAYSFGYQIENGLPILPYYDNKNDIELNHLMNYLKSIHHVKDVRDVNRRLLKIGQIADFQDPLCAVENLYKDLIQ